VSQRLAMFRLPRRTVFYAAQSTRLGTTTKRNASIASIKTRAKNLLSWIGKGIVDPSPELRWFYRGAVVVLGAHIFFEYFYTSKEAYGVSMVPTMNSVGDSLIISKLYRRGRYIEVGDVVSFKHPIDGSIESVKRVLGMPGDFVLRDTPDTSGMMIQVPEGHCWVIGDNLKYSRDSRMFGPLPLALIKGKVISTFSSSHWPQSIDRGIQAAELDKEID
jgi:inner membrane protease subunit 1